MSDLRLPAPFLSCLLGSELMDFRDLPFPDFLSCLLGSERTKSRWPSRAGFLSCLLGSEPKPSKRKLLIFKEHASMR